MTANLRLFALSALVALMALVQTSPAHADGDAGCGLGSMIISDNSKLLQLLAATTNNLTLSQMFGISTGTSNCKAQNFVMNDRAIQYFAEVNQRDLSREMSEGRGEKLALLASLYGCRGNAQGDFSKLTQSAYGRILPTATTSTTEMVHNLNREFQAQPDLVRACSI